MPNRSIAIVAFVAVLSGPAALGAQEPKPATPKPSTTKPSTTKPAPAKPGTAKPATPSGRGVTTTLSPAARAKLKNPAALKEVAPAEYRAAFDTSAGPFVIQVHRSWAPKGADRFYNLVKNGFFDNTRFFRVLPNFMVQFGINGDPTIQAPWRNANLQDDPVTQSNKRGTITFATAGPNSRTTQVFINFKDNAGLDRQGFAPFGEVVSGIEAVDKINAEYKELPQQPEIQRQGNVYLNKNFPKLDYVRKATIQKPAAPAGRGTTGK